MGHNQKPFIGKNWGTHQIILEGAVEFRPEEVHVKEDGAKDGGPSLCFVMRDGWGPAVYGQISLAMLNDGLAACGYRIERLEKQDEQAL